MNMRHIMIIIIITQFILLNIITHMIVAIKCKPDEKVQHRTMQGNCMEPIKDADGCFKRAVGVGILKNKNQFENMNYWGEGDWDIFPFGCLYVDGIITFNTNKTPHTCGINNKAMCLCMPACYKIQHPFKIALWVLRSSVFANRARETRKHRE